MLAGRGSEVGADDADVSTADALNTAADMEDDKEFQKFLADLAMMMEEQEEGFRQVEEDFNNAASLAISGNQNMQYQQSMTMRHI